MNKFLIFFGGICTGALLLYLTLYMIGESENERVKQDFLEKISNEVLMEPEVQYVEIKGKKGIVEVYTGMPKDSIRMLAGKPDDIDLYSIGNKTIETWKYKIKNKYVPDLRIEFENGRLSGIN
jgi:hypothetical protein